MKRGNHRQPSPTSAAAQSQEPASRVSQQRRQPGLDSPLLLVPWRSLWVTRMESGPGQSSQSRVWGLQGPPEALLGISADTPGLRSGGGPIPAGWLPPRLPRPPHPPPAHSLFAFFVNVVYLIPVGGRKERAGCRKGQGHSPSRGVVRKGEEGRECRICGPPDKPGFYPE